MVVDEGGWAAGLWAMAELATPMAVRVSATLHVADHITAGRRTAPELAEATGADADARAAAPVDLLPAVSGGDSCRAA